MSSLVLITGASGHLGFRTLVLALQAGHRVISTVRREEQADEIASKPSVRPFAHNLSFAVVKDITAPNAFDEAIKGVTDVIHLASPLPKGPPPDEDEKPDWEGGYYSPARNGTLNMLETAAKTPSVRRVVITSSAVVLAGLGGEAAAGPYDIKKAPTDEAAAQLTNLFEAYITSKVIAHEAATDFAKNRKRSFDIVRVLPGYVEGANELNEKPEHSFNGSNGTIMRTATGQIDDGPKLTAQVLLEDVAKAHVLALDPKLVPDLTNLLLLGNGGKGIPWDDIATLVEQLFPHEVEAGILKTSKGQEDIPTLGDVSSTEAALGFKFAGGEEMVKSVVGQYLQLRGA